MSTTKILNIPVQIVSRREVFDVISDWVTHETKPRHLVTLYSEFVVQSRHDPEFLQILQKSALNVPDGVSILAAVDYQQLTNSTLVKFRPLPRELLKIVCGLWVGFRIITGKVGETVTGVWLTETILKNAPLRGWKVFLLGGYGTTVEQMKFQLQAVDNQDGNWLEVDPGIQNFGTASAEDHQKIIDKINKFRPDFLLVSYGPVRQEKWINQYRGSLKAKVIVGVGGTFDELTGKVLRSPQIFDRLGLKWLWRLMLQPSRAHRIFRAVIVFPWLIWRSKNV